MAQAGIIVFGGSGLVGEAFQRLERLNTVVVGIPHYDLYLDQSLRQSREEFCAKLGLDPQKKILVYGAVGEWAFPREGEMGEVVAPVA